MAIGDPLGWLIIGIAVLGGAYVVWRLLRLTNKAERCLDG